MLRSILLAVAVLAHASLSTGCCCCTDFMKGFRQGFNAELRRQEELDRLQQAELARLRAEEERKLVEEQQKLADLKKKGDRKDDGPNPDPFKDGNPAKDFNPPKASDTRYTYSQSTGQLKLGDQILGVGYSGIGAARNNSARQAQQDGPIPIGEYRILQRGKDARIKREAIGLLPFPKTHLGRFPGEAFAIIFEPVPPETVPSGAIIVLPRNVWDAITTNTHLDVVP